LFDLFQPQSGQMAGLWQVSSHATPSIITIYKSMKQ
jgi:hypothetical protein